MVKLNSTICITGASGTIGRHILIKLHDLGYHIRVLTRHSSFSDRRIDVIKGDIRDLNTVKKFLNKTEIIFHCAGEIEDQSEMWAVNVKGTENLMIAAENNSIKHLFYISSVGVIGKHRGKLVNEDTPCNPLNQYEKTKYAAERIVAKGITGCSTVILRPTNVIDEYRVGALKFPISNSFIDLLKMFVIGGENAHVIHASDVADAAIFLMYKKFIRPICFIVSCDEEKYNTYGELWSLYKKGARIKSYKEVRSLPHLPIIVPYTFRRILRGYCNRGDIIYSMAKIKGEGFKATMGVVGAVESISKHIKRSS